MIHATLAYVPVNGRPRSTPHRQRAAIGQSLGDMDSCDAVDTITSATSYKPARPLEEAIRELESGAATQFDPNVVSTFVRLVDRDGLRPLEQS